MGSFASEILLSYELDILLYWISLFCLFFFSLVLFLEMVINHTSHFKNDMLGLLISDL